MAQTVGEAPTAGRRRDPGIEPRVTAAAVTVYAREGWGGLTFDSVAREAGVGKPAIYRRWNGREELLVHAFDSMPFPTARDMGSARADLLDYAGQWLEWYSVQDRAVAGSRISADCRANPALRDLYDKVIVRPRTQAARDITRRAIRRGEVAPTFRSSTMTELLLGAMSNHWLFTQDAQLPSLRRTFAAHAEQLVDIIIAGVQAVAPGSGPTEP